MRSIYRYSGASQHVRSRVGRRGPLSQGGTQNLPVLGDGEFARAVAQFGEMPHLLVCELDHLFKESVDPP